MRTVLLLIFAAFTLMTGCKSATTENAGEDLGGELTYDTSKFAIIAWGNAKFIFDSSAVTSAQVTHDEIEIVDSLVTMCAMDYNKEMNLPEEQPYYQIANAGRDYKKQLVPVINAKGEKQVWVNCICRGDNESCNTNILSTKDGGHVISM